MAGFVLRVINLFVQGEIPPGIQAERFHQPFELGRRRLPLHQTGRRDGSGVDHRVTGPTRSRIQADRVERITRWLHSHLPEDGRPAVLFQGHPVHERFGDRLDREGLGGIAHLINGSLTCGNRNAEPVFALANSGM